MYPCEHCGQPRDGKSCRNNSGPHDCIAALKQSLADAEAAAQWCWVRLGDGDYDLACTKWKWLNASSVVLHERAAKAGGRDGGPTSST